MPDKSVNVSQDAMTEEGGPINIPAARRAMVNEVCNEKEVSAPRAVAGSVDYIGRETRPDLGGPVSLLQSTFPKPKVADLREGSRLARIGGDFPRASLRARPICVNDLGFYAAADAAWASAGNQASQAG